MAQSRYEKNTRRRATLARRKQLFDQLRLQAELAFESNRVEHAHKALSTLLELLDRPLNDQRRKALVAVLAGSGYTDEAGFQPVLDSDGDCLTVSGSFSFRDLSSKLVWESHTPETVEG